MVEDLVALADLWGESELGSCIAFFHEVAVRHQMVARLFHSGIIKHREGSGYTVTFIGGKTEDDDSRPRSANVEWEHTIRRLEHQLPRPALITPARDCYSQKFRPVDY